MVLERDNSVLLWFLGISVDVELRLLVLIVANKRRCWSFSRIYFFISKTSPKTATVVGLRRLDLTH